MFSQLFGRYLVEKSVIKEADYKSIISRQLSIHVKLGTIAIAEGFLTAEQVEDINLTQRGQDKCFGDIAVEKNYLTAEQTKILLEKQGDPYLQFIQLLKEVTKFTDSDIASCEKQFQKEKGFSTAEMEALKQENLDALIPIFVFSSKPYVSDIAGLIVRNLIRFVSRDFYIGKAQKCEEFSYKHLASQKLSGDEEIHIALAEASDEGAFLQVASKFSRQSIPEVNEDALDSVCEFINIASGLLASSLSSQYVSVDLEPPKAYESQSAKGDFYVIPIYLEDRPLHLLIAVNSEFDAGRQPAKIGSIVKKGTAKPKKGSKATVLLVDDSKMSRSMLRNILEKDNYTVVMEASNGVEGLDAYMKCKPDIVTLDITMPEMDGLEALRMILNYDPDAKAIMITAAGQQDKLIEALKCGAKRFISKPFNEDEILINLSDMLEY